MNLHYKKVYVCQYNYNPERNSYNYEVTDDATYAKLLDANYQLASINDLLQWVAGCGEIFYGIVTTKDGLCKWYEREYIDELGDIEYDCGYELI